MECPVCKKPVPEGMSGSCKHCGADLEALHMITRLQRTDKTKTMLMWMGFLLCALFLVLWLVLILRDGDAVIDDQTARQSDPAIMQQEIEQLQTMNNHLRKQADSLASLIPKPRKKEYVVSEGETLFLIARRIYGNGLRYVDIVRDNRIGDPDHIRAGTKLTIYY
ncbi:MAG: LysM peptidoglycan-binding domain-containing protein [Bacteroidales bacterium]|nr:LysM peptidoglycan-binding domain-containing protein [Bacteroidales bacterium]